MNTKKIITTTIVICLIVFIYKSCGLSISSDSSCKSTLCEGYWSYEYNGEAMISKYGNFSFEKDGTCHYYTIGHQINGTWQLGDVIDLTKKLSYRAVNMSMESSINEGGAGSDFTIQLWGGDGKSYLGLKGASAQYFHFNDNNKPIN